MRQVTFPRHAPIDSFGRSGSDLLIGGVPLTRLAARVGQTPFYAYDRQAISDRIASVRRAMPSKVKLHYAMKANPMPEVLGHVAALADGIDVASGLEMRAALNAGVLPRHVSYAGPGKTRAELAQAIASGVSINLESVLQYELALAESEVLGIVPRLAIRVNPAYEVRLSGMHMGGGAKPFGIDEADVPDLLQRMKSDGVSLVGLQVYSGSQSLNAAALMEAQRLSVSLGVRLAANMKRPLEWLNVGGGFGVAYFPGNVPLDLDPVGAALEALCQEAERELSAPLIIELGRYLVAEAGVYVCKVIDRKVSCGRRFLVVDGGLHHNLAASGNFGQVIRKNYPIAVGNRMGAVDLEMQTVVGPLCTPLDLMGDQVELPTNTQVGDLIVLFMAGAYGLSASPTAFLSHPQPAEVLV